MSKNYDMWCHANLPTWFHCDIKNSMKPNEMTYLEKFILDNEPAGTDAENLFREGLINLLNENKEI